MASEAGFARGIMLSTGKLLITADYSEFCSEESIDWKMIVLYFLHVSNEEITLVILLTCLYIEGKIGWIVVSKVLV